MSAPRHAPASDVFPLPRPGAVTSRWRSTSGGDAPPAGKLELLDRPRDKLRGAEVSLSALQFLFSEIVSYSQSRVAGIADFERLLSSMGHRVGTRMLALLTLRTETASNPKNPKRETRLLPTLLWINSTFWRIAFGAQADSLERSTESGRGDECMWTASCRADPRYDLVEQPAVLAWDQRAERNDAAQCRVVLRRDGRSGTRWARIRAYAGQDAQLITACTRDSTCSADTSAPPSHDHPDQTGRLGDGAGSRVRRSMIMYRRCSGALVARSAPRVARTGCAGWCIHSYSTTTRRHRRPAHNMREALALRAAVGAAPSLRIRA